MNPLLYHHYNLLYHYYITINQIFHGNPLMSMASQPKNPAEWRLGVVISAEAVKWWVEELSHGGSKRSGWKPFHVAIISTPSMIENKYTQIPWEWDLLVGGDWNMTFIFP